MIEPAILWKEELIKAFSRTLYTEKYLWYEGSIENYEREITEEADKFQFAIVDEGQLIGFISFRVDWYCSCAYNFGLIKFVDNLPAMVSAIREVIRMIKGFNLHRIDFRCVGGNPAEDKYDRLALGFFGKYSFHKVRFRDNIKDTKGNYHDTVMYELIKGDDKLRGIWIIKSNGLTNHYACNQCDNPGDIQDKFCRYCGAEMDFERR